MTEIKKNIIHVPNLTKKQFLKHLVPLYAHQSTKLNKQGIENVINVVGLDDELIQEIREYREKHITNKDKNKEK